MRTLRRLWDWLLPGLIYLDPMVATGFAQSLAENQASHASVRRLAVVSEAPIQRRVAERLMLASTRISDVSPGAGPVRL